MTDQPKVLGHQGTADPRLRRIEKAARSVLKADEHYAAMLNRGSDKELQTAQTRVWRAIANLRRVVEGER